MSAVNWDAFRRLPGSPQHNFEMLCRALIRRHYGRFGQFAALANQPGVEFHLNLHTACPIGNANDWFGWQCRWYKLPSGTALGAARRKKIAEALSTTERVLPDLTDWILWTRHPLTKGDQKWFYRLKSKMRLGLWTSADVEDHLSGDGTILRGTYFGELILLPDTLANLHGAFVARVRKRWLPQVHQAVDAERTLRRMLGEAASWDQLSQLADSISRGVDSISAELNNLPPTLRNPAADFIKEALLVSAILRDSYVLLGHGDLDLLRQRLEARPRELHQTLANLPRHLRSARQRAALATTNTLADLRLGLGLLNEVDGYLGTRLVSVLAEAGGGKTQLAAQLTAPEADRPAGILLYGQDLHAGQTLNDLVRRVVIPGTGIPVSSIEALIGAVDAAGQRARRRLPILIDGLNESEDPRDWKGQLASLNEVLRQYPHVLVICTLRTGARIPSEQHGWPEDWEELDGKKSAFADEALPEDVQRLAIPNFAQDTYDAIRKYFAYFRISRGDSELPFEMLSHPLTLRLFCEVTNPTRAREVGIEAMPGSLTGLFDRYLTQAAERITELSLSSHRYYEQDVRSALDELGIALWESRTRELNEREFRKKLGDDTRPWNASLVRALEQEGVILRLTGNSRDADRIMAVYDAMAGHLVGSAILSKYGRVGFGSWLNEPATQGALTGTQALNPLANDINEPATQGALTGMQAELNPLANDIFHSLVGLVPRRHHRQQLWPLLEEPMRTVALTAAADLEGVYWFSVKRRMDEKANALLPRVSILV